MQATVASACRELQGRRRLSAMCLAFPAELKFPHGTGPTSCGGFQNPPDNRAGHLGAASTRSRPDAAPPLKPDRGDWPRPCWLWQRLPDRVQNHRWERCDRVMGFPCPTCGQCESPKKRVLLLKSNQPFHGAMGDGIVRILPLGLDMYSCAPHNSGGCFLCNDLINLAIPMPT